MPSADFCHPIPPPHGSGSTKAGWQISPGNARSPSHLCPPHLLPCTPYRYWALNPFAFSPGMAASYAVPVRRASDLPAASFRSHLAMDTLAVRLTVPPVRPVKDLHLQVNAPCRAHKRVPHKGGTSMDWFWAMVCRFLTVVVRKVNGIDAKEASLCEESGKYYV